MKINTSVYFVLWIAVCSVVASGAGSYLRCECPDDKVGVNGRKMRVTGFTGTEPLAKVCFKVCALSKLLPPPPPPPPPPQKAKVTEDKEAKVEETAKPEDKKKEEEDDGVKLYVRNTRQALGFGLDGLWSPSPLFPSLNNWNNPLNTFNTFPQLNFLNSVGVEYECVQSCSPGSPCFWGCAQKYVPVQIPNKVFRPATKPQPITPPVPTLPSLPKPAPLSPLSRPTRPLNLNILSSLNPFNALNRGNPLDRVNPFGRYPMNTPNRAYPLHPLNHPLNRGHRLFRNPNLNFHLGMGLSGPASPRSMMGSPWTSVRWPLWQRK